MEIPSPTNHYLISGSEEPVKPSKPVYLPTVQYSTIQVLVYILVYWYQYCATTNSQGYFRQSERRKQSLEFGPFYVGDTFNNILVSFLVIQDRNDTVLVNTKYPLLGNQAHLLVKARPKKRKTLS